MKKLTIKTTAALVADGMKIPVGTKLSFGTEGYAVFRGKKITKSMIPGLENEGEPEPTPEPNCESGEDIANAVISILTEKYPDGFTANQIAEDFNDTINGSIYSLNDSEDGDAILTLTVDEGKTIKIFLKKDETDVYTLNGKFDASECDELDPATEAFIGRMFMTTRK